MPPKRLSADFISWRYDKTMPILSQYIEFSIGCTLQWKKNPRTMLANQTR